MRIVCKAAVALTALLALAFLAAGCSNSETQSGKEADNAAKPVYYTPKTLRVGLIPNIAPDKQKAKYEPFKQYLEKKLDMPVELFVASNYTGVVQAMVSGKLDLAYFGGLTYAQALEQTELEPIVTEIDKETGTTEYYSLVIAEKDSTIDSLKDLNGKTFAFGDPSSTSGSLYPRLMLVDAGYDWKSDFKPLKQVIYTGGHDATAQAVASGKVDAGGIEGRILAKLVSEGKVDGNAFKVIEKRLVQGYPWCVPTKLDPAFRRRLVDAFTEIDDAALLDLMRAKRYVAVSPEDYEEIRAKAKEVGLVKAE
ncbi:MAG: phosphate/phosphite/phosphonate ABC transporter substrate-binding protein [Candidatus Aquicultorales bacterium]